MDVRRVRRIKIGLAALAVLGLGAALTSALWTDDVFFEADVSTGVFNLQGAVPLDQAAPVPPDPASAAWVDSADITAIELDLGDLQVSPDESTVLTGYVRNDPTSTWTADASVLVVDQSALPTGVTAIIAWAAANTADPAALAPGEVVAFEVTVESDGTVVQGETGGLVVMVSGASLAPAP